jgi:2-dehydro-3-deoxygluconokinase
MIELTQAPGGLLARGFGGDTLNTAIYLARLGAAVDYVTALGDDAFSDAMAAAWREEGVGTGHVLRIPGKLPGLYIIETSDGGERRFHYWRDSSAARALLDQPASAALLDGLAGYALVYLSGITLSLYDEAGRARLMAALARARRSGTRIAFDTNFRPRNWPDAAAARAAYAAMLAGSDIVLASLEDLDLLHGAGQGEAAAEALAAEEVVLKLHEPACRLRVGPLDTVVRAAPVAAIDTTAAGDSFAAAYLAARLAGRPPVEAAAAGHRLAGAVVGHRGAIIPRAAMPAGSDREGEAVA